MNKKRAIINIFIYNVIFVTIFSLTRLYILKNDFLLENIKLLNAFVFIAVIVTSHILAYKYCSINRYFTVYIACALVFQISIYSSPDRITIKNIVADIISLVICAIIIKFFNCKKLNDIMNKFNSWIIISVYFMVLVIENIYTVSLFIIFLMLKYYYMLKKDKILEQNNFDIIIALILFSVVNAECCTWCLIAYSYRIEMKAFMKEIKDL